LDYPGSRLRQRSDLYGRRVREHFAIAPTDQNGTAARASTSFYVAPAITYHKAARKIDTKLSLRVKDHAGFWLSTLALVLVIVLADLDSVKGQHGGELCIELVHVGAGRYPTRYIWLVGHYNEQKTLALQFLECCTRALCDDELACVAWRVRFAVTDNRFVQYAIAI
jgi:hypothetical protein